MLDYCVECGAELDDDGYCTDDDCDKCPTYEFEGCEDCIQSAEKDGIEYEQLAYWENGTWICSHCGNLY